jgi:hypothetical protein
MAKCELVIHVRVAYLGGTASCDVCSLFFAWKLRWDNGVEEQIGKLACPRCRGSAHVHERSLVPEIEITGPLGTETVLATVGEGGDA